MLTLLNRTIAIDNMNGLITWVLWCSGYHICLTRRWSRVRTSPEPVILYIHTINIFEWVALGNFIDNHRGKIWEDDFILFCTAR